MIDITQLAQDTITTLAPLLPIATTLGAQAGEGFAKEAGKGLFEWVRGQFKGKPAEAVLDRAIAEPENPFRQTALRNEIEEMATNDPAFRAELERLLAGVRPTQTYTQSSTQIGSNNSNFQVQGSHNTIQPK